MPRQPMNRRITLNAIARGDVPCCVVPDRLAAYALTGRQGRPAPTPITRPAVLSPWHPPLNAMPGSNRRFICSLAEIPPRCGDLDGSSTEKANPAPRAVFDQSPARNARMLTPSWFSLLLCGGILACRGSSARCHYRTDVADIPFARGNSCL
jgi:hypothetical protein